MKTNWKQVANLIGLLLTAQQAFSRTNLAYVSRLRELWLATVQIDGMLLTRPPAAIKVQIRNSRS